MALKAVVDDSVTPIKVTVTSDKRAIGSVVIAGETVSLRYDSFKWNVGTLKPTLVSDDGTTAVFTLA